jgi:hypothetical protein
MHKRVCFKLRILLPGDRLQRPKHVACTDECDRFVLFDGNMYIYIIIISLIDYPNN